MCRTVDRCAGLSSGWAGVLLIASLLSSGTASSFAQSAPAASNTTKEDQRSVSVAKLEPLPVGLTLPVRLGRTLRAGKTRVGLTFVVKMTQRVPVTNTTYLNRGAELEGKVVASVAGDGTAASPAILSIEFTTLRYLKQAVAVNTRAIAIANFVQVGETFLPVQGGADRGNASEASWTTTQVGGDQVARSGWVGDVVGRGVRTVGHADYFGVYALPVGSFPPRAMGVFSTTATGLYGFESDTSLRSVGGVITLTRSGGKSLEMRDGDNLLLEVVAPS
ncbi:hypothetical protein [Tunturiibacter gelidoferens]|jgi:hypothetical protein|uniref:Uncharacterized protein n=1 Tax=Tunturiibacter gelidiferens TaxID=3069689 RepID=A0A9X0QG40_9BACT|nr:hypothetical protein [Edaphobacter lichenicola]MBB5329817.1 hypothetical protein [Edaphobacter lichenicola]